MGANLYNRLFDVTLNDLREWTGNKVALLGNIPPRDVLANGSPAQVTEATVQLGHTLRDTSKTIFSCGGGMPPGVSSENIDAFIDAVRTIKSL